MTGLFKIGEIRELIRLLDETNVSELRVETDDMKFHIKKAEPAATVAEYVQPAAQLTPVPVGAALSAPAPDTAAADVPSTSVQDENVHYVTSPMVGTFYRSPSPDAPSYVEQGAKVNAKSVVCIVEAMKLMNEIEAEVSGEVIEVLADNGQLVEYGQPIVKIRLS